MRNGSPTRLVTSGTGSSRQRLDRPYVRKNGKLQPASWDDAFAAVAKAIKASGMGNKVGAIAGDLASVEDMYALKALMTALGSGMTDVRPPMSGIDPSMPRSAYLFNPDHCRHRGSRCHPQRRLQSAQGSAGAQCAHPQGLARQGHADRGHRRSRRPHLWL